MPDDPGDRRSIAASAGVTLAFCWLAWRWLGVQDIPSGGRDEFFILEIATELAYRLFGEPLSGLHHHIFGDYYPPLGRAPGVVALMGGAAYRGTVASQWVWLPVGVGGVWWLAHRLRGPGAAFAAVVLFLAGPGVADCMHHFETNLGHTCAAAGALAAWVASDHFANRRASLVFGLLLGLGLMSDRLGVLPLVIVPVGWSLVRGREWRTAGLAAGVCLLICGWWYASFAGRFLHELLPQLLGGEVTAAGDAAEVRAVFPFSWLHYLLLWVDTQLGLIGGSVALVGLGWAIRRRSESAVGRVVVWLGAGLLLFTLIPKRQPFYTLPLLPAAAVLGGCALAELRRFGAGGVAAAAAILLAASVPVVANSWPLEPDWNPGLKTWAVLGQSPLPESVVGRRYPMGGPPRDHGIELEALPDWLAQHGIGPDDLVLALSVDAQVTESYLLSLARMARRSVAIIGFTNHPDGVQERHGDAKALLYITRDGTNFPGPEQVRQAHEQYFGWEPQHAPLLEVVPQLEARATGGFKQQLAGDDVLHVWVLQ